MTIEVHCALEFSHGVAYTHTKIKYSISFTSCLPEATQFDAMNVTFTDGGTVLLLLFLTMKEITTLKKEDSDLELQPNKPQKYWLELERDKATTLEVSIWSYLPALTFFSAAK